jgi:hypothetical protein
MDDKMVEKRSTLATIRAGLTRAHRIWSWLLNFLGLMLP